MSIDQPSLSGTPTTRTEISLHFHRVFCSSKLETLLSDSSHETIGVCVQIALKNSSLTFSRSKMIRLAGRHLCH